MQIEGTVHCLFEQSGTFKNEFRALGIPALDYDIQNNFAQTDHVVDLFGEIEKCVGGGTSVFDSFSKDDLIMAFFPCIYFETIQQLVFALASRNQEKLTMTERIEVALDRLEQRTKFHALLYRLLWIAYGRGLRLIIENPATPPNYLITGQNFPTPTIIDKDRMKRGDFFKKPTAYWFINCEPTYQESFQNDKTQQIICKAKKSPMADLCSEERSMMSPDYARNFICDFILGQENENTIPTLFDDI